jgi:cysteine synthase
VLTIDAARYGLLQSVVDTESYERSVQRFREAGILLPTFAQLADPSTIPADIRAAVAAVDHNAADPRNLFRVHWYNGYGTAEQVAVPEHIVLPPELTGVASPIVLVFGNRFPMITAHKVLAAYACLVPRVVSGQFDPTRHRAVWPSTGNYARGGVAISRLMQCRGVAVLPENMSRERFDWLDRWVTEPGDVIRTPGSESNVKEIYDACNELEKDPGNFILNQFSEFANHIGHYTVTGRALGHVFDTLHAAKPSLRLAAFVSASGSAGTLGAGDRLKDDYGAKIVAVEALECPTMLYNGFGEHNIQGIGDKHIPLIHNVMNTDLAVAISDRATDGLNLVFTTDEGTAYLRDRLGVAPELVAQLRHMGFSSICNMLAAIKTAKQLGLGPDDVVISVATDGSELYESEKAALVARRYPGGFGTVDAAELVAEHLQAADTSHTEELTAVGRNRIFNLGYYTWVEQQGVELADFEARRHQPFWDHLHTMAPGWDAMIDEFNARTGVALT